MIKVRYTASLLEKGFVRYHCYARRRAACSWVAMRWARDKKARTVRISKAFLVRRPKHNTVRLKCFRSGELVAVLYMDNFRLAETIGKMWQRKTKKRTYVILDWRFGAARTVSSSTPTPSR